MTPAGQHRRRGRARARGGPRRRRRRDDARDRRRRVASPRPTSYPASTAWSPGLPVAASVFDAVGQGRRALEFGSADGAQVSAGEVLATVRGPIRDLLTAERTALNLLGHLSGVATLTRPWVDAVAGTGAQIRDTRKTMPGLRALEKYAVRCGGGVNHRMSLSDAALVKDNHVVAAGGVVRRVRAGARRLSRTAARGRGRHRRAGRRGDRGRRRSRAAGQHDPGADLRAVVAFAAGRGRLEASGGLDAGPCPRGRRDRRRLPCGRCADPFGAGPRHRAWTTEA